MGLELFNSIDFDDLSKKIEEEQYIEKIRLLLWYIAWVNPKKKWELVNRNIDVLSSKIAEDIEKIKSFVWYIARSAGEEARQELVKSIDIDALSSKINKEEDMEKIVSLVQGIAWMNEDVARELVNRLNPKLREELQKTGWLR